MDDSTRHSDRILADSRALVRDNRDGGRHRRGGNNGPPRRPIGEGSARIRRSNLTTRIRNVIIAALTILLAAGIAGAMFDGIGFWGVMIVMALVAVATMIFSNFPKVKTPQRADLAKTQDARQLVARTELWLEHQRPALPAPAARLVDDLGVQLDALGKQLAHVDPAHPAAAETRKLVGDVLPETIDAYGRIPAHLRGEERSGSTPDAQLVDSLGKISREIDSVTRQLAEGSLDDLAIRTRYLDYRYGEREALAGPDEHGSGVPLPELSPDFTPERSKT
ncbi:hypothetical protein GRI62_11400 [Erythrobacter arachoides]|uniref:Uncharacterized protein n=1 Tax=Aurantiacibacter arachoides TaxID=1850444 RepID=A0A845A3J2_9SPHN|nr:hypothetical protein [Aurantiacibacter arachoides]MXO94200.1 hypothetical protein [Aurantiacibacter arachoides]GGD65311.1 hypothetical protein GCM10011411_27070 [Aurantiacibacter arachoides]